MRKLQNVFWLWLLTLLCVGGGTIAQTISGGPTMASTVCVGGAPLAIPAIAVTGLPTPTAQVYYIRLSFVNGAQTQLAGLLAIPVGTTGGGYIWTSPTAFAPAVGSTPTTGWAAKLEVLDATLTPINQQTTPGFTFNPKPVIPSIASNAANGYFCGLKTAGQIILQVTNAGSNGIITATPSNGALNPFPNSNSGGTSTSSTSTDFPVSATPYTVSVTTNVGGCVSDAATTSFTVAGMPVAAGPVFPADGIYCAGGTLELTASVATGTNERYEWIDQAGVPSNTAAIGGVTPLLSSSLIKQNNTALTVGSHLYWARLVNSTTGCVGPWTSTAGYHVVNAIPALPTPNLATQTICAGNTFTVSATSSTGATINYSITTTDGAGATTPLVAPVSGSAQPFFSSFIPATGQTLNYSLTATLLNCTSAVANARVIVNPKPVAITAINNAAGPYCNGATLNLTAAGSLGAGESYEWTDNMNNGTPPSSTAAVGTVTSVGTSNPLAITLATGIHLYWARKVNVTTGCVGPWVSQAAQVDVKAIPQLSKSADATICSGAGVNVTATSTTAGASINYTVTSTVGSASTNFIAPGTVPSPFASVFTSTTGAVLTYTFTSVVPADACPSPAQSTVITINTTPSAIASIAPSGGPLCTGASVSLTASGSNGTGQSVEWVDQMTAPSNTAAVGAITPLLTSTPGVLSVGNHLFWARRVNTTTGCIGPWVSQATVTRVYEVPVLTVSPNQTICAGNTFTLSATSAGATINHTITQTIGAGTTPLITPASVPSPFFSSFVATPGQTLNYTLSASNPGCTSATQNATITVNPKPASITAINNAAGPYCNGATLNLTAAGSLGAGESYEWTDNMNNGTPPSSTAAVGTVTSVGTSNPLAITLATGIHLYWARKVNVTTGCVGDWVSQAVQVDVKAIPQLSKSADATICSGAGVNVTATSTTAGASINYTVTSAVGAASTNFIAPGTVPAPFASVFTSTTGAVLTYTFTSVVPGDGCVSPAQSTVITINMTPAAIASIAPSGGPLCTGASVSLTASGSNGTGQSVEWVDQMTAPSNTAAVGAITPLLTSTPGVLSVGNHLFWARRVNATTGCIGPWVSQATVTQVYTVPVLTVSPNQTICAGNTFMLSATSVGATINYSINQTIGSSTTPLVAPASVASPFVSSFVATPGQTLNYTLSASNPGCTSATQNAMVTVNPAPSAITAVTYGAAPYCNGSTLVLTASNVPASGETIEWTDAMTPPSNTAAIGSLASAGSTTPLSITLATGQHLYWARLVNATTGCIGPWVSTATVIDVKAVPTVSVTAASTICGGSPINLTATGNIPGMTLTWTNSSVNTGSTAATTAALTGTTVASTSSTIETYNVATAATDAKTITYRISGSNAGCVSASPATTSVLINASPTVAGVSMAMTSTVCEGGAFNLTNSGTDPAILSTWSFRSSAAGTWAPIVGATIQGAGFATVGVSYAVTSGVTPALAGQYAFVSTNGCTSPIRTLVVNLAPIKPVASIANVCVGATQAVFKFDNALTFPSTYSYLWSGPAPVGGGVITGTAQSITVAGAPTAGTYTLTVTENVNFCTSSDSKVLVIVSAPAQVGSYTQTANVTCQAGTPITITANLASPMIAASNTTTTFEWVDTSTNPVTVVTAAAPALSTTPLVYTLPQVPGTYVYRLRLTDRGCTTTASQAIQSVILPSPQTPTISTVLGCNGRTLTVASPTAGTNYTWTQDGGVVGTGTLVLANQAGTYSVSSAIGLCASTPASLVLANAQAAMPRISSYTGGNTAGNTICAGETLLINAVMTGPVPSGSMYQWIDGAGNVIASGLVAGPNVPALNVPSTTTGTTEYRIVIMNAALACNYTATQGIQVTVRPTISTAALGASSTVASCTATTLSAPALALIYNWSGPNGFTASGSSITASAPGAYNLSITDINGCSATIAAYRTITCTPVVVVPPVVVPQVADLSVIKDILYRTVLSGDVVYITIAVTNDGPNAATNVKVRDVLPAGMTYVSGPYAEIGSPVHSAGIVTGTIAMIPSGQTRLVRFNVRITGTVNQLIINGAEVSGSDQSDPDSTPGNGVVTEDDYDVQDVRIVGVPSSRLAAGEEATEGVVISTYPNPSVDKVTIEINSNEAGPAYIHMTDAMGRKVGSWNLTDDSTSHKAEINVSKFNSGTYIIRAEMNGKIVSKKIMKGIE